MGLGFGQLAAAVASMAHDLDGVVETGLVALGTGFRLAVELQRRAQDYELSSQSWACTIHGIAPSEMEGHIAAFNSGRHQSYHAYAGIVSQDWTTVFAPPTSLAAFCERKQLRSLSRTYPKYPGSLRASHIPGPDIDSVAELNSLSPCAAQRPHRPVYHTGAGLSSADATFRDVLLGIVSGLASERLPVEDALQQFLESWQPQTAFEIVTFDNSALATTAAAILSKSDDECRTTPSADAALGVSPNPSDALAIVGMSGRFPESDSLAELWEVLSSGKDCHKPIPDSRFDAEHYYNTAGDGQKGMPARWGCFLKKPGDFDHRFFNISPKEAMQMDPQQRMLLMATYEAMEMAGYSNQGRGAGRVAAYFGQTTDDWKAINDQQGIETHYLPALNRAFAPGRLSHFFKWDAGFYSIDTGCSSSATCVCLARDALANGECDAAVIGGGSLLTAPEWYSGLGKGGFLSKTGACKTYQQTADGYCRGEAVAVLVLKRLDDALKANDNVLAVIAGAARNGNAGAGSITHPGEEAQVSLYKKVLRQAGITGDDISMIEMHGTGTQAGDKTEMTAVRRAVADARTTEEPMVVGAVKASVGHSEAAAGAVSLIKSVLMLQKSQAPRQPHYPFALNPKLGDVQNGRIRIANGQSLPRKAGARRSIMVNCFDAAGGNTSMIVQDPPILAAERKPDPRTHHVVLTSGKTRTAHEANRRRLRQYLTLNPRTRLADLAYTTTARRFVHDTAFLATHPVASIDELMRCLDRPSGMQPTVRSAAKQQLVFACTGQGSQYNGMASGLYGTSPTFARILDSLQRLCTFQDSARPFIHIFEGKQDVETATPAQVQMATVAVEIALARFWQGLGLEPSLTMGHSLGEYAALCIAGVLSAKDALFLVYQRAALMAEHCGTGNGDFGMLAVQLPASTIQEMITCYMDDAAEVSCFNGPSMTVVSGHAKVLTALEQNLTARQIKAKPLQVQYAFHSRQMDPVLDEFERIANGVHFHAPKVAMASTLLGRVVEAGEKDVFNGNYLRRQMREPVDFVGAAAACEASGVISDKSLILEIGPQPVCTALLPGCLRKVKPQCLPSIQRGTEDWNTVSRVLAATTLNGVPVQFAELHKDFLSTVRPIHDLPSYAFDLTEFWRSYETEPDHVKVVAAATTAPDAMALNLTALQKLDSREITDKRVTAVFSSQVSDETLAKLIHGHNVGGTSICPASVFIDMAYSAALFVLNAAGENAEPSDMELEDLSMKMPLVAHADPAACPTVHVHANFDKETKVVAISFTSNSPGQSATKEHGSCRLIVSAPSSKAWSGHWSRMQSLIQTRVRGLEATNSREAHTMNRDLMYKVFSEVVDYSKPYQCVDEITLPLDFHDAAAQLTLEPPGDLGQFTCNPFAMDSIVHIVGFLLNGNVTRPKNKIHIANWIGRFHVLHDLSKSRSCRCYAALRETGTNGTTICDAYVFDDTAGSTKPAKLLAVCTDIRFQCLEQDFFSMLCGKPTPAPAPRGRSIPAVKQKPVPVEPDSDSDDASMADSEEFSDSEASTAATSITEPDSAEVLLKCVSKRSGLSVADMDHASTFTDMGIDSQMSIAIVSDFQKETGVELPATFFSNCPTVADVQDELGSKEEKAPIAVKAVAKAQKVERARSRTSTRSRTPARSRTPKPAPKAKAPVTQSSRLIKLLADTLETPVSELKEVTSFAELGVDSMMSIQILGQFQKDTGIELPASFFNDYSSVAAIQEELDDEPVASNTLAPPEPESRPSTPTVKVTPASSSSSKSQSEHVSRAILIQGKSRNTDPPLFLVTDGSGTVESYIHFPALPGGRRIYGLESPFADRPEEYNLSIEEMCDIFIESIMKIQPRGPYLIGGWSAGSVYAYEIARRLTERGNEIEALLIMDMRVPSLIPRPQVTMPFIERLGASEGLKGAKNLMDNLSDRERAHLWSTCRALARYYAIAFPKNARPKTVSMVWATKGLNEHEDPTVHDNRVTIPAEMGLLVKDVTTSGMTDKELEDKFELIFKSWFYGKRLHFGTNGWEKLLGENINVHKVDAGKFYHLPTHPSWSLLTRFFLKIISRLCSYQESRTSVTLSSTQSRRLMHEF